jgi:methylated-DNA-[protein]-cysteine S-methyltransferase
MSPQTSTDTRDDDLFDDLGLPMPPDTDTARLRAGLVERAESDGLLDVAYRTVDTPYGALLLAATPRGLVRLAFEGEGHDTVLAGLAGTVSPRILRSGRGTDEAARQLEEYFDRRRRVFDVPLDLRLAHGFRRDVLGHLQHIAYGRTESYSSVAVATGHPKAVRAVGGACSHNPVPIIVPCHRVVRSDGTIGHYLGGTEMKVALLAMEAAAA